MSVLKFIKCVILCKCFNFLLFYNSYRACKIYNNMRKSVWVLNFEMKFEIEIINAFVTYRPGVFSKMLLSCGICFLINLFFIPE